MTNDSFEVIGHSHPTEGFEMKEKEVPYSFRFQDEEKYMFISRVAYFKQSSVNDIMDQRMFGRTWKQENADYKAKQKKLGITDAQIITHRKNHRRYWKAKKSA